MIELSDQEKEQGLKNLKDAGWIVGTADELLDRRLNYKPTWRDRLKWKYTNIRDKIRLFPREIKWKIQRMNRGYSDCDLWGFDTYLSDMIARALKDFNKMRCGFPMGWTDEKWDSTLKEIQVGWRILSRIHDEDNIDIIPLIGNERLDNLQKKNYPNAKFVTEEEYSGHIKKAKKQASLLVKYLEHIWD